MSITPYQISVRRIIIGFWIAVFLLAWISVCFFMPPKPEVKEKIIREDKETGTKYIQCEKWDEVRFRDGTIMYAGNCNSEYENGVIG